MIDKQIKFGEIPTGKLNKISDVSGVKVGHATIDTNNNKTGVTIIMPTSKNVFLNRLVASSYVLNGYGKTAGLIQVEELGQLETPIALTNTLNVGIVHDAIVEYIIECSKNDDFDALTINPVVGETNDSYLNDIKSRCVTKKEVFQAISQAKVDFDLGDVGAGKGTTCYGFKGGIGSSSRVIEIENNEYTVGILVQSNFGLAKDLVINKLFLGDKAVKYVQEQGEDKGSIMVVLATDAPLSERQIKRCLKRITVGLARTGSYIGHGSGDVFIGFSTANQIDILNKNSIINKNEINENYLDCFFRATIEAVEESVINSMLYAKEVRGYKGNVRKSLLSFLKNEVIF